MNKAILQAKQVSFSLARKNILEGIDFTVLQGEVIAVVGKNGAGKTTLFHLLAGLKFPQYGSIEAFGFNCALPQAREKVSFVLERPYLNLNDTASEMLTFYAGLSGLTDRTRIQAVLKEVGLIEIAGAGVVHQKLKTFSKGMLQRLLIAQALLSNPELIILDEPMSGLDPEGRVWLKTLLQQLKAQKKTIVFSTHALEDAQGLADQMLILENGKLKSFGKASAHE